MAHELTRREFVKGTLATAGALASIGSNYIAYAQARDKVKRGGIWRYARNRTVPGLDAHRASEYFTCMSAMYDCLIDTVIDPKTYEVKLVPGLATEWHIEKGNKRIIFALRKGVYFHDGSKFDATVAKWNLERLRDHPKSYLAPDLKVIENVEVLNENTIALNLKYPSAGLLYSLSSAWVWAGMVSKAFQEKHGDDELNRKGCGTGGFRYKNWIVDEKVVLERFPDYWKKGIDDKPLPYLDGMEEHYRPKIDQAVLDLRSGVLDTVHYPAPRDVAKIKEHPDLIYLELPPFEYQDVTCGFNPRKGPFTSLELRRACCYALDRERFVKITGFGVSRPHMYPYTREGLPGWSPKDWPDYTFNPKKARDLVKSAYPKGVTVNVLVIAREPDTTYGELIKAMWEAVGIKVELKTMERLEWINNMKKDNFEIGFWQGSTTPGGFIRIRLATKSPGNWSNISNPEVDRLLEEHARTFDESKRHELMKEALKIVYDQALLTCATALTHAVATHKKVKGIRAYWRTLVASEIWMA
ncbi:MAG: ABC transporter substrate-binding protein [Candidatus Bathyarchaeia archaeon]